MTAPLQGDVHDVCVHIAGDSRAERVVRQVEGTATGESLNRMCHDLVNAALIN